MDCSPIVRSTYLRLGAKILSLPLSPTVTATSMSDSSTMIAIPLLVSSIMQYTPLLAPSSAVIRRSPTFWAVLITLTSWLCRWNFHCSKTTPQRKLGTAPYEFCGVLSIPVIALLLVGVNPDYGNAQEHNDLRAILLFSIVVSLFLATLLGHVWLRNFIARIRGKVDTLTIEEIDVRKSQSPAMA